MEYTRLGESGLIVSRFGLGTMTFGWQVAEEQARRMVHAALDAGVTWFDTADVYGGEHGNSEEILAGALSGRRDEVVVATKLGRQSRPLVHGRGSSRSHIRWSLQRSLKRLRTDYVDLMWIHEFDPLTPLEETLRTLDDLVGDGAIRYLGVSNFAAFQLAMACAAGDRRDYARPIASQFRYNPLAREAETEMLPACRALGVGGIAYNPLAGGLLADAPPDQRGPASRLSHNERYRSLYLNPRNLRLRAALAAAAADAGAALHEWALRWPLGGKGCDAVLLGATSHEQLAASLTTPATPLPAEARARIDDILRDTAADPQSHDP